jgi:hypothetical protein
MTTFKKLPIIVPRMKKKSAGMSIIAFYYTYKQKETPPQAVFLF